MKEDYFKEVISEISQLCCEIRDNEQLDQRLSEPKVENLYYDESEIKHLEEFGTYDKKLEEYLLNLSDTTINVLCALMDFGRNSIGKILPINLNKVFNKVYLPYWFDMNEHENKRNTVDYLISKKDLDKYLNRAEYILFNSKDDNIEFKCQCGGLLHLPDSGCIELLEPNGDYKEYALHLKCFWCENETVKYVDENFLNYKSI